MRTDLHVKKTLAQHWLSVIARHARAQCCANIFFTCKSVLTYYRNNMENMRQVLTMVWLFFIIARLWKGKDKTVKFPLMQELHSADVRLNGQRFQPAKLLTSCNSHQKGRKPPFPELGTLRMMGLMFVFPAPQKSFGLSSTFYESFSVKLLGEIKHARDNSCASN